MKSTNLRSFSLLAFLISLDCDHAQTLDCPSSTGSSTFSASGNIRINVVPLDTLCTLTMKVTKNSKEHLIPLGRSYDNHDWETVAGPYPIQYTCIGSSCETTSLPESNIIEETFVFQLTTYSLSDRSLSSIDVASRFLEQATFGPTMESLAPWKNLPLPSPSALDYGFATWIDDQINTEETTSHRAYFRKRTFTRSDDVHDLGVPLHPCDSSTRWHSYALTAADSNELNPITFQFNKLQIGRSSDNSAFVISVNGVPRTEVQSVSVGDGSFSTISGVYDFCFDGTEETEGGFVLLRLGPCMLLEGGNPKIAFTSSNPQLPPNVISLSPEDGNKFIPLPGNSKNEEFILTQSLTNDECNDIEIGSYPVYLNFNNGTYLAFDPRLAVLENTIENPLNDGGGKNKDLGAKCSNAPRTFLNTESCKLSSQSHSCNSDLRSPDLEARLTNTVLSNMFSQTGRYVYAINGLRPEASPCIGGSISRWEKIGAQSVCPTNHGITTNTYNTLANLLESNFYFENNLREIVMPVDSSQCDIASTTPSDTKTIKIIAESFCWELVHPNHHDVYDMSSWVGVHPGGEEKITQFADSGSFMFEYPASHEMFRWESNKGTFAPRLGVYDQIAKLRDFPDTYQFRNFAIILFGEYPVTSTNIVVCGSPNEVSHDTSLSGVNFGFELGFGYSDLNLFDKEYQKQVIWTNIALNENDQLRQRMAWAISQIFAVNPSTVMEKTHTEGWLSYYDIFVRHAFGNYLDILREVSYSAFMAEMLTYHWSQSTAFAWLRFEKVLYADENYAREIMQLFTIGTTMMNMDGTPIIDSNTGATMLTYTNEHIMSFARAWTGFIRQDSRGNVDQGFNRIDPMKIEPGWRDVFPKIDLFDGYIGDGYPLCMDMPERSYLRKGAQYRLLGSSTTLQMHSNPRPQVEFDPLIKFVSLNPNSNLYNELCRPSSFGGADCDFPGQVTLDENLQCYGQECLLDTVRFIEVTKDIYFEYVRLPCVQFPYYNNAKKIMLNFRHTEMCGDSRMDVAGEACCDKFTIDHGYEKNCQYAQERVTYNTASQRCSGMGLELCSDEFILPDTTACDQACCTFSSFYHWHDKTCELKIKVQEGTGKIAVIHKPSEDSTLNIPKHLRPDSFNFFPVHWTSNFPEKSNNCGDGACEIVIDGCLCPMSVEETSVFSTMPSSVDDLISSLKIGSVSPDTFNSDYYDPPITNGDMKVYLRSGRSYDAETIFEVQIQKKTKYFKNMKSVVQISNQDGNQILFSFRNPPHFVTFLGEDYVNSVDVRDIHYETEAVLQHYVSHPNVPPFLAIYFIQRFGISNPSPKYIEAVAKAFKDGIYKYDNGADPVISYGSGEYADLGATVAAVILHREARSIVLDFDPMKGSLKEPLLKVISFMRAMEYKPFDDYQFEDSLPLGMSYKRYDTKGTRLNSMTEKIGQMVYFPDNIFSFFRREFTPSGPVQNAALVAPEAQRYTTAKVIGLVNGLLSMIKFGLSDCNKGFGEWMRHFTYYCFEEAEYVNAWGKLSYLPSNPSDADSVVDEMATLLTAGRLNSETRQVIANEIEKVNDDEFGLRLAQQLMITSPEFHSTDLMKFNGQERNVPEPEAIESTESYKAVVYLFLEGGMDSFNLIVPHSGCPNKNMYNEYASERGVVGIPQGSLLRIDANEPQVCSYFGVHPHLPILKNLYDEMDLAFFANVGVLFEPVTKDDWDEKTLTQLFAHNIQQRDTQQVDPQQQTQGTGVLGRMADALTLGGYNTGSYSLAGEIYSLIGVEEAAAVTQVEPWDDPEFNPASSLNGIESTMFDINNPTSIDSSGIYGTTWSQMFEPYVRKTESLREALESTQTGVTFPESMVGKSLQKVAELIKTSSTIGDDRQMFHVKDVLYDTHGGNDYDSDRLQQLNEAISSFVQEMKGIGMWENVVLVCASDFGRTLTPNTSGGTDHGWGGNYFMLGGDVKGGKILGEYPDDLTVDGPLNVGRGRFIPTTSWDSIMNSVAKWMGVADEEDLSRILPNRNKFNLIETNKIFPVSTPTQSPTSRPITPTTPTPTVMPVQAPPGPYWWPVAGQGGEYESIGSTMTDDEFRVIWDTSPNKILRRLCSDCLESHSDIYYRRFDTNGILPTGFDLLETVKNQWVASEHNEFNIDFALYSTYEDSLEDSNRWTACNFAAGIGFPRDCGPNGIVGGNWNNFANHAFGTKNVGFYVETRDTSPTSSPIIVPVGIPIKSPTSSPINAPVDIPTKSPINYPTPTKTPSDDTQSPAKDDLWYIDKASVVIDVADIFPLIKITHEVGAGADSIAVSLLSSDCSTLVPENDPVSIVPSSKELSLGLAQFKIKIDESNLSNSVLLQGDQINFCTNLELIHAETGHSVSFRKSKFSLTIDMNIGFFVVHVTVNGMEVDDFALGDISLYRVDACQCQLSFFCDEVPVVLEQNSAVSICIKPSSSGVKFSNFILTITGNEGFSYSPITLDSSGQIVNTFTTVEEQGIVTRVTTQLLSQLFEEGSTEVTISGNGQLELTSESKLLSKNGEMRNFELKLSLEPSRKGFFRRIVSFFTSIPRFLLDLLKKFFSFLPF